MKKELKIKKSWYNTLNWQAAAGVVANNNINADNWYFTNCINIACEKTFWNSKGEFSPRLMVDNTHPWSIPFIQKYELPICITECAINRIFYNSIRDNIYIYFNGADDYYIEGKQSYLNKHFYHDGLITGIDNTIGTYTVFAYNIRNQLNCFKVSKESIEKAFFSKYIEQNGTILLLKCKEDENIEYNHNIFKKNLESYLLSKQTDFYKDLEKHYFGIKALKHLQYYVQSFFKDHADINLFDLRVFLSLYENKMCIYNNFSINFSNKNYICNEYYKITKLAERIRYLSIKFKISGDYNILNTIVIRLEELIESESKIIPQLLSII